MQNLKKIGLPENPTIAIHDGVFHADELFLMAIFKVFFGACSVVRTRDEKKIKAADMAADVGMRLDPKNFRFDHHQFKRGSEEAKDCALTLWIRYAEEVGVEFNFTPTQTKLIEAVRARDTRVNYDKDGEFEPLLENMHKCNSIDLYSFEQEHQFKKVLGMIVNYFSTNNLKKLDSDIAIEAMNNSLSYDNIMNQRFSELVVVGVKNRIKVYRHPQDKHVDTKLFQDKPFILISYDEGQDNFTVTVDTDYCKITRIEKRVFIHPNKFMAKTLSKNPKFEIKLVKP